MIFFACCDDVAVVVVVALAVAVDIDPIGTFRGLPLCLGAERVSSVAIFAGVDDPGNMLLAKYL
jgi:hypothetical protein